MARTLTVVAVGLILLGVMIMAGPTFGFSTIASDRSVNVSTASNSNALLGIHDDSRSAAINSPEEATTIYKLEDNVGSFSRENVTLDLMQMTDANDNSNSVDTSAFKLEKGGSGFEEGSLNVQIRCSNGSAFLDSEYYVELNIVASGSAVTVDTDRETTTAVPIDCTEDTTKTIDGSEDGNVTTGGSAESENGADHDGNIIAGGDVTISSGSKVRGDIISGGNVTIENGGTVNGVVYACGEVTVGNGANYNGPTDKSPDDIDFEHFSC